MTSEAALIARVMAGFALAFVVGFERRLRGSPAGDRTFALVGGAHRRDVQDLASGRGGGITGIGFIGAGIVFHGRDDLVKGLTTAAGIFAVAGIGVVVGTGHLVIGALTTTVVVLTLELRYIPGLGLLDARRYEARFRSDHDGPDHHRPDHGDQP